MKFLNDKITANLNAKVGKAHFIQYSITINNEVVYVGQCYTSGIKNKQKINLNDILSMAYYPDVNNSAIVTYTVNAVDLLDTTVTTSITDSLYYFNQPKDKIISSMDNTFDVADIHYLLNDRCADFIPEVPNNFTLSNFYFRVISTNSTTDLPVYGVYADSGEWVVEDEIEVNNTTDTVVCFDYFIDNYSGIYIGDKKVANVSECNADFYLVWKTRNNCLQCQPFKAKSVYSESIKHTTVNDADGNKKNGINTVTSKWQLNTGWIDENVYSYMKDILTSSTCQLIDIKNNKIWEVYTNENTFTDLTFKNDKKLLNFTINVEAVDTTTIY